MKKSPQVWFCAIFLVPVFTVSCLDRAPQPEVNVVDSQDPEEVDDEVTSIVGRVLNYATGEGIEGVRVESFAPSELVLTREDGGYALVRDVQVGEVYTVQASALGFGDASSTVLASRKKETNVDLFMVPEADLLPVAFEPSSLVFDHTTHTVSARLHNNADKKLHWCINPARFVLPDGAESQSLRVEPSQGTLEHDASKLVRFTLPSGFFSSFSNPSQTTSVLHSLFEILGGTEIASPEAACTQGSKTKLLSALSVFEPPNPYTIHIDALDGEGSACITESVGSCTLAPGRSLSVRASVHDARGRPVEGTRVVADVLRENGDPEDLRFFAQTSEDGTSVFQIQAPDTQENRTVFIDFQLDTFRDVQSLRSGPLGPQRRVPIQLQANNPQRAVLAFSERATGMLIESDFVSKERKINTKLSLFLDADATRPFTPDQIVWGACIVF